MRKLMNISFNKYLIYFWLTRPKMITVIINLQSFAPQSKTIDLCTVSGHLNLKKKNGLYKLVARTMYFN